MRKGSVTSLSSTDGILHIVLLLHPGLNLPMPLKKTPPDCLAKFVATFLKYHVIAFKTFHHTVHM